jgi:hypothetical protein
VNLQFFLRNLARGFGTGGPRGPRPELAPEIYELIAKMVRAARDRAWARVARRAAALPA